jgi:hypothetical protein
LMNTIQITCTTPSHIPCLSLCSCFKSHWPLDTFSNLPNLALLKDLTDLLPNYACWELQKHLHTRLHKDILSVLALLALISFLFSRADCSCRSCPMNYSSKSFRTSTPLTSKLPSVFHRNGLKYAHFLRYGDHFTSKKATA